MRHSKSALVLFTLSPEAEGKRKPLGLGRPERAAGVYKAMLRHLEEIGSDLPGIDLLINTPGQPLTKSARHMQQKGAQFGESLRLALEEAFSMGYQKVVVIGNDAPEISRSYIKTAFARLESAGPQAVMGPSRDGGYALLGLSQPCAEAFESMPWGSGRVARLTEERLFRSGFQVDRLATLQDIDNRGGLNRFLARARRGALAGLAKEVARLLTTGSPLYDRRPGPLQEVLFMGWRALRAPPYTCWN